MNGKVLLFQVPQGVYHQIQMALASQQVAVQMVTPGEYGRTIGQIAMLPTPPDDPGQPLDEPMMVLCLPEGKLEGVLAALRSAAVPPICKAVLTATNAGWTPQQLLTELQRERSEFRKMGQ